MYTRVGKDEAHFCLHTFIADLGGVVHTSIHPKIKNFCEGVFKSQSGSAVVVQLTLFIKVDNPVVFRPTVELQRYKVRIFK